MARSVEKVADPEVYNGDHTKLKDALRGTVIVRSPEEAKQTLTTLSEHFNVTGAKNRFEDEGPLVPIGIYRLKLWRGL